MHPVSPYLGTGPIIGAALAYAFYQVSPRWLVGEDEGLEALESFPLLALIAAGVVILGVVAAYSYAAWRRSEYRVDDDALHHRKGIVFRQHRQARLDRIEAIDVVQPLLARVFGLARLTIEVAGGSGSAVNLDYLRLADAEALRNEMLALVAAARRARTGTAEAVADAGETLAAGDAPAPSLRDLPAALTGRRSVPAVAAAPERDVYRVPTGRLLGSIALSAGTAVAVVMVLVAAGATFAFQLDVVEVIVAAVGTSVFAMVGLLVGVLGYFWQRINGGYGFTATVSTDGLRLRHGLLETRKQTVAPGRVQALSLTQGWVWRRFGWWRVRMNVAGYQDDQEKVSVLLPVGSLDDALLALWLVLPDVADRDPNGAMARALMGSGSDDGFTPSPRRARLFDPIQLGNRGVLATDKALFIRRGFFTRELLVVPNQRVQSLSLSQGPWDRRRRLAAVEVQSTPGPVAPVAAHLDLDDAIALIDSQAKRVREHSSRPSPEQWAQSVGIHD